MDGLIRLWLACVQCAQVSARVRITHVRLRQLERDRVQRELRRLNRCVAVPVLSYHADPQLTVHRCPGAEGFVARESVSFGNLTVPDQAIGESPSLPVCGPRAADGPRRQCIGKLQWCACSRRGCWTELVRTAELLRYGSIYPQLVSARAVSVAMAALGHRYDIQRLKHSSGPWYCGG